MSFELFVELPVLFHRLVGLMMTPEMRERREERSDATLEKLQDRLRSPENVRLMSLAHQMEPREESDFRELMSIWAKAKQRDRYAQLES